MSGRSVPRKPLHRLVVAAWLLLVWLAVLGSYTTASLVGGLIVVALLMVLFPARASGPSVHAVRPIMLVRFVGYYVRELVVANVHVAEAVVAPGRIARTRAIVEVPLVPTSRLVGAILANGVMLTPGTSIIEVADDPPTFYVHVLELSTVEAVRSSIAELQLRIVRAIGPADRLDEVTRVAEELRRTAALAEERHRAATPGEEPR